MPFADRLHGAFWIALGLGLLWLLALLSPILAPFLLAVILAYICNPLVGRVEAFGLPRVLGVLAVLLALGASLAGIVLILTPLITEEARIVAERLPEAATLIEQKLLPWLRERYGIRIKLDAVTLRKVALDNVDNLQAIGQKLLSSLQIGGIALLGIVANLLLTPVAMFYLLMDWQRLTERIENALPRPWHARAMRMARDIDRVLSEYLRGQLAVMALLAVYYSAALWLVGLPSALAVGLLTGLLIFIPYLGYATGLLLAVAVAALQFAGLGPIVAVLIVFGIGQLLESFLLTPFLVGERIGLHPLAVIFALMAFGQLFGFFGVLLALPASAVLLVGLRELRTEYLASPFYRGNAT